MNRFVTSCMLACGLLLPLCISPAQTDWETVWQNFPPGYNDTGHPNYWMRGSNSYSGLAYDKWNDVLYVVNPATCGGPPGVACPKIHAWVADSGTVAMNIENANHLAPPGQLYVNWNVVTGGFSYAGVYNYALFRIALDDEGRIYSAGVGTPGGAAFRVYRWDTYSSAPVLLAEHTGHMLGTSFAVRGKSSIVNGQPYDSVRIFASGGKFVAGYDINSDVYIFVSDQSANPPLPFIQGIVMMHNENGSAIAAHGLAPTGSYPNSQIYMDSNNRETVLNNQNQGPGAFPQFYTMTLNSALPVTATGHSGAIRYFRDEIYKMPYLICADGLPDDPEPNYPNDATRARVVNLSSAPLTNWPPSATPQTGNKTLANLIGEDNWISDVDYKIWVHPETGQRHLQLFVLMGNNGIGCYRTIDPLPVPVEMETFRAAVTGTDVELVWQVASELNNRGFEVHRSYNRGSDWEQIGFIEGRGTATSAAEYSFTDPLTATHREVGTVQYRLRQVDFDGVFEWTSPLDVYITDGPTEFIVASNFPNPFNPATTISFQLQREGHVLLTVFNMYGEEITTLVDKKCPAGLNTVEFNAAGLTSGPYIYRIETGGESIEKKMVLLR